MKNLELKALVMNLSGNVGKSTVAREMFAWIKEVMLVEVESVNTGSEKFNLDNYKKFKGNDIDEVYELILTEDNVIVDIGASNVDTFFKGAMSEYEGYFYYIDYFIIPVVPTSKESRDTVRTIKYLVASGIEADKIVLLFNKMDSYSQEDFDTQYSDVHSLFEEAKKEGLKFDYKKHFDNPLIVPDMSLLNELNLKNETLSSVVDGEDWDAEMKKAMKAKDKKRIKEIAPKLAKYKKGLKIIKYRQDVYDYFYGSQNSKEEAVAK